jgi:hypothetical protein
LPSAVRQDPQVRDLYFGAHAAAHLAGRDWPNDAG